MTLHTTKYGNADAGLQVPQPQGMIWGPGIDWSQSKNTAGWNRDTAKWNGDAVEWNEDMAEWNGDCRYAVGLFSYLCLLRAVVVD